jgi:hypothetical protein
MTDKQSDAGVIVALLEHPELQEIGAKMVHLYHTITERALANEGGP